MLEKAQISCKYSLLGCSFRFKLEKVEALKEHVRSCEFNNELQHQTECGSKYPCKKCEVERKSVFCRNLKIEEKFSLDLMGEFVTILFNRKVNKTVSEYLKQKPMTGIKMTWYFEDINGEEVEVVNKPDGFSDALICHQHFKYLMSFFENFTTTTAPF